MLKSKKSQIDNIEERAIEILQEVFHYEEFRPFQLDIIKSIASKKDTLAVLPTGGGKSLTYQIPALMMDGMTVVISPLISLMADQIMRLKELNISAEFLNSSLSMKEYNRVMDDVYNGNIKLLYVAPETLMKPSVMELLQTSNVELLAVDEAHCISEWGHEFRPDYRQIPEIRQRLNCVCLALTATATEYVRQDMKLNLEFDAEDSSEFVASFDRTNLDLTIVAESDKDIETIRMIERHKNEAGIIYCFSRKQTEELTATLQRRGYKALAYHAGLGNEIRTKNQKAFMDGSIKIIVSTIAFGMGIDKRDVRYVIHYDLPKDIESYYQQIGRAGRDGKLSECLLLYGYKDISKIQWIIGQMQNKDEAERARKSLNAILTYVGSRECRRKGILKYFGEKYKKDNCGMCDNCKKNAQKPTDEDYQDVLRRARNNDTKEYFKRNSRMREEV